MKLSHIFEVLASGELVNLSLAADNINIKPERKILVLRAINRAMSDLHTRFLLRKAYVALDIALDQDVYTLAVNDLVEITDIYLNDKKLSEGSEYIKLGVNTFKVLIKLGITEDLRVEYKAGHKVLTELDIELDTEVNLPSSYLNAVAYFVANCLITPRVNQLDGDLNEGVAYMSKYEKEIGMLSQQGIDVDALNDHNLFTSRGFI